LRSKATPYLILAVLLVITLAVLKFRGGNESGSRERTGSGTRNGQTDRNRGFDRRTSFLEYTRHARCRMECRKITQAEVQDIMREGKINYRKSDVKDRPCPTYALEGYTDDNQHVRIVFAQCDQSTKVVTCIDLEREWQCDCPGDDKSKNR
jgi:hypothetical protein